MKRISTLLTFVVVTLCSYAYDVVVDGIYYNLVSKTKEATITYKSTSSADRYTGAVIIPSTITVDNITYSVTSIGHEAFRYCSGLTSLSIPNSVTSIGGSAFSGCSGLTSVIIPNSVTSIGYSAFFGCSSLTSVTIGNSVSSIGDMAFSLCSNLTSVVIPNSVTSIGGSAFSKCSNLTTVTIPNSVTSIGNNALEDCSKLTSVIIPNFVTSIRSFTFKGCTGLTVVTIPNSVTSIGASAFSGCNNIISITIGNSVHSIDNSAFAGCQNIETVTCLAENIPSTDTDVFKGSYVNHATLIVPATSLNAYKSTVPWSQFGTFKTVEGNTPSTNKCAAPSIAYENGMLYYVTATPGAQIISEIKSDDFKKSYDNMVTLSATYNISAYATKSGYEDSDVANATLHWMNGTLDTSTGAKEFGAKRAVLVSSNDGFVNISGLNDGEKIEAFTTDGKHITTTYAAGNAVNIAAKSGEALILKIGDETIKTMVK